MTGAEIAETLNLAASTVSGILARIGMAVVGGWVWNPRCAISELVRGS
jgi:hypothetical protein